MCDYYKDGNLSDYIAERACKMKEFEIAYIVRGILAAISQCHFRLNMIIGNLNPEGIACDFNSKKYHTRLVNFNHAHSGANVYMR